MPLVLFNFTSLSQLICKSVWAKCSNNESVSWNTRLYVNLLTSSVSFSFLRPNNSPTTSPTPLCPLVCLASGSDTQYPHCVAVLLRGGEKEHISAISALLFSVRTQRNDSPACSNSRGNTTATIELPATCYFRESARFLHLLVHLMLIFYTYLLILVVYCILFQDITLHLNEMKNIFLLKLVTTHMVGVFLLKVQSSAMWFCNLLISHNRTVDIWELVEHW